MRLALFIALLTLNLVINTFQLYAQGHNDDISVMTGAGYVIPNHPDFPEGNKASWSATLRFARKYNGFKPWHRHFRYPRAGLDITGGSMGYDAVLGHFVGAMGFMSFDKAIAKRWERSIRLSLGGAWFNRPYDESDNPGNVVVGSSFSFLASAELGLSYRLNNDWRIVGGAGVIHSSNSHFRLPNVGMNMPVFIMGGCYRLSGNDIPVRDTSSMNTSRKLRFNLRLGLGINESGSSTGPVNGPKYPVYIISATVSRMFSPVSKVSAGVEAWYNKGVYDYIVSQEFYDDKQHEKAISACVVLGHEFLMGRWGLITTGGVYFYNPFYRDKIKREGIEGFKPILKSYIPARLGVQYHLKNTVYHDGFNLFVGLYIKSNFGQADFLESGLGVVF